MKKKYAIMYIMLLVVPAVFIGVMAVRWLRYEEERLRTLAEAALEEQAAVLASHLDLLLHDMTDAVLNELAGISGDAFDEMRRWRDDHPLVRQVFAWHPDEGLLLPGVRWANAEEQSFMLRYDAFFSGRRVWPAQPAAEESVDDQSSIYTVQRARQEVARRAVGRAPAAMAQEIQRGWLPWFWERDAHLLGWMHSAGGGIVRGVELELLAACARFHPFFVDNDRRAADFALYDHNEEIVMQTAGYERLQAHGEPVRVAVSALLPHWQIGAVAAGAPVISLVWVSWLLLAILLVAILAGGGLLAWQGYRDYHDAMRKTTFVSNVSHELKTPLTTIRMYAEMLREKRINDERKRESYLAVIADESMRLTRLVNNVLDFSRLEQRRRQYRRENIELAAFLRQVAAMHTDRMRASGIELKTISSPLEVIVCSDRDALEQTLLNLLDNAAKYAASGGEVELVLVDGGNCWNIEVADRGPGVPDGHEERIFGSFYRVDDSLTARYPGTGLGLSIGRRLMRELGGDLVYRPRAGGGAEFVMSVKKEAGHA